VTLQKLQCKKNNQMFVFLTSGPHHLKKQNKTRKTKTSQTVNKNNPAQNFFSIAQFPTKKQNKHPFCPFYNQKIYTSSISHFIFEVMYHCHRVFRKYLE